MESQASHNSQAMNLQAKPSLLSRLLRRRTSSTSEGTIGSPPNADSKMMEGQEHFHPDDEENVRFANPGQAIPMPWK